MSAHGHATGDMPMSSDSAVAGELCPSRQPEHSAASIGIAHRDAAATAAADLFTANAAPPPSDDRRLLRPYDGIQLCGPSVGARADAALAERYVVCAPCLARARFATLRPKFFKYGKALRDHLNTAHPELSFDERVALLVNSEREIIVDRDAYIAERCTRTSSTRTSTTAASGTTSASGALPPRTGTSALPFSATQMSVQFTLHPALVAARDGDLDAVRAHAAAGVDVSALFDKHGSGAIHWAAGAGHTEICRFLVEAQDADPVVRTQRSRFARNDGKTPLHWAARNGHCETLRFLLAQGVPVDVPMLDESCALDLAVFGGHVAATTLLAHSGGVGAYGGDWRVRRNAHQCTIAHWAGMGANRAVCAWLLHHEVPFDTVQKEQQTPLHKAAAKKNFDVLAVIARTLLLAVLDDDGGCDGGCSCGGGHFDDSARTAIVAALASDEYLVTKQSGGDVLVDCAACSVHAADPNALCASRLLTVCNSPCERLAHVRSLFQLRDTSGLSAMQIAIAQGMPESHEAARLLRVLDAD